MRSREIYDRTIDSRIHSGVHDSILHVGTTGGIMKPNTSGKGLGSPLIIGPEVGL